jgi:hypothetical protein
LLGKLPAQPARAAVCVALAAGSWVESDREAQAAPSRRIEEVYEVFDNRPLGMVSH